MLPVFLLNAQDKYNGLIWSKGVLTWEYFQETEAIPGSHALARTYMKLQLDIADNLHITERGKELKVKVYALMIPSFSYVKKGSARTSVLAHEQMHFDILELAARQLRKEILEAKLELKDYERTIHKMNRRIWSAQQKMQDRYDKEHLSKDKGHNWWANFIKEELDKLDAYRATELSVLIL